MYATHSYDDIHKTKESMTNRKRIRQFSLHTLFMLIVIMSCYLLLMQDQILLAQIGYVAFSILVPFAYFTKQVPFKVLISVLAFSFLLFTNFFFPLTPDGMKHAFNIVPIILVFIFPSTIWPIFISLLLTISYAYGVVLKADDLQLFTLFADCFEMVSYTVLATILGYYQVKLVAQLIRFRSESYSDYLTALNNRKSFIKKLQKYEQASKIEKQKSVAVIVLGLDSFKKINDQFGYAFGDETLKSISMRLLLLANEQCELFRLGGDEFAFILRTTESVEKAGVTLANAILDQCNNKRLTKDAVHQLSCSIGLSFFPSDTIKVKDLYHNASLAMHQAKNSGKNCYCVYNAELANSHARQLIIEADLKRAIEYEELKVYYQPKVCTSTGQIIAAEALLRWVHPQYGFISPLEFISIAEENGSIFEIGSWVLTQVCKDVKDFIAIEPLKNVAVNVSPKQMSNKRFVEDVKAILDAQNCPSHLIEIEQTESALMNSSQENILMLNKLRELGITISLDDFGTVYSSLSLLSRLPVQIIKIDKQFVDHCADNFKDRMIVRTIIQLAKSLNMQTVAEGVETQQQLDVITTEGCDTYQGYYFSKPVTKSEFIDLIAKQNADNTIITLFS